MSMKVGDRVGVRLESEAWAETGWFAGTIVQIDPYSENRAFYWVELDRPVLAASGGIARLVSVLNPRNIRPA